MSPDALDHDIQDYLDDRMAEPRRRAFEARIADDAELARRVRALREIGAALAGGDERLSPDFYSRLRARFEPSQAARTRRSRTHRWEALGLAAAALIALALFVPQMLEDRLPGSLAPAGREAPAGPAPPPPSEVEQQEAEPGIANEARKKQDHRERTVERKLAERAPAQDEADERESIEQAPSAVPEPAPQDSRLDEAAPSAGAAQGEKYEPAGALAPHAAARSEGFAPAPPPTGLPVRPGLVERESVVEIDDRAGWERLELAALGRYDPARRVVLVGDRDGGLDCAAARLVALEEAYEIRLVRLAAGIEQDGHACAFVLPRDGRPVRVVGPPEGGP